MTAPDRFAAPTIAARARPAARVLIAAVTVLAAACVVWCHGTPLWAAPEPPLTVLVFVAVIAAFNQFGAFERYGEFASYVGLDGPVVLALLFVVDYRLYALGVALGECAIFISESARRVNPTVWYLRVFNVAEYLIAGAVASVVLGVGGGSAHAGGWGSPALFFAALMATVVWKALDAVQTHVVLALATGTTLRTMHTEPVQLAGEFSVLFAGVPLAVLWSTNAWLALFAFAAIAGGSVLLHVSETEHRLRIDERTGLTNAAAFDQLLETAIADSDRQRRGFALLVIDIDHFKAVNDSFGHDFGDKVITWFARRLSTQARSDDVLARVGGEEFTLLVRDTDRRGALATAERVRGAIADAPYVAADATQVPVTASIGIAVYPDDGEESRELFRRADGALYDAKRSGRNRVRASAPRAGR